MKEVVFEICKAVLVEIISFLIISKITKQQKTQKKTKKMHKKKG